MNKRRKKRNDAVLWQIGILLILIVAITVVVILILKPDSDLPSGSDDVSSQITSDDLSHSSDPENSALPTAAEPTVEAEFWGNKIDLSAKSTQIEVAGKYPKWHSEPGFTVPEHDLSFFKANASSDKPLNGAVVFLDPGHGGQEDWGAVFPRHPIPAEIIERDINLLVAFSVKELLEDAGASVVMTREENYYYQIMYRYAVVAKHILNDFRSKLSPSSPNIPIVEGYIAEMDRTMERNNDKDTSDIFYPKGVNQTVKNILDIQSGYSNCVFLSLHCNASPEPDTLKGTRVFYETNESAYRGGLSITRSIVEPEYQNFNATERKRFAELIYSKIVDKLPDMKFSNESQAVVAEDVSGVIRETNVVGALVEMGYVNHTYDRAVLLDETSRNVIALAIFEAILSYYCG
ncbi:MAG: N-acetylmuramoyl-L-alanine amidase [Eubacteriales bacterium]|nr:N-acetylmuramoyl-L-alanine amidase [Eubacteriales bacterium]MDD4327229.1 N-acetylmuramoyl-L-alanine amidase [Eubacteriales bacterium]MDD4717416.1 N-acetylmuramoyl-L-alanine amidase [Eubacteriales bacterium]